MADERFYDHELDRFWDEVVHSAGGPVAGEFDLDPATMRSVRRFQDRGRVTPPDPIRDRVRRSIMARIDHQHHGKETPVTQTDFFDLTRPLAGPNGRIDQPSTTWPRLRVPTERRKWLAAQFATALLLVVTLVAIYFAFLYSNEQATPIVAPSPTPIPNVPLSRGNAARTGESPGPGPSGLPVKIWSFTGDGSQIVSPIVGGGLVYAGNANGLLFAIDELTGQERWRFNTGTGGTNPAALVGDLVIVSNGDGSISGLDWATGAERWHVDAGGAVTGSPDVLDGTAYLGPGAGLLALDATTGRETWRFARDRAFGVVAIGNGMIFAGDDDGILHSIDPATGTERWQFQNDGHRPYLVPAVAEGMVFAAEQGGDPFVNQPPSVFYALDATTGAERWRFTGKRHLNAASVTQSRVLLPDGEGFVRAFDAGSGTELWRIAAGEPGSPTVVVQGVVYAGSWISGVYAIDVASGNLLWQVQTLPVRTGPVVADGLMLVASPQSLDAFAVRAMSALPATASPAAAASPATANLSPVQLAWTTPEFGPDALKRPGFVALDPEGRVWVSNAETNEFFIYDRTGRLLERWGTPGAGPGQFAFYHDDIGDAGAIAFAPNGDFYVVDSGNNRIQKFDRERTFLMAWGTKGSGDGQFLAPLGIVIDAAGNVFVTDVTRHDIQRFDANGAFLDTIGVPGTDEGQLQAPGYPVVDGQGNLWVPDIANNRILIYDPNGELLRSFGSFGSGVGQFSGVCAVVFDRTGNVFILDQFNNRIQVLAPDGTYVAAWGHQGSGDSEFDVPQSIALDGEGGVYVVDWQNNRLQKFRLLPPLGPEATPTT